MSLISVVHRRTPCAWAFCLLLLIALGVSVQANPGVLDTSFGNGGKAIVNFSAQAANGAMAEAVLTLPNNKVLVAGGTSQDLSSDMFVMRLNSDGSLDTSFGKGGMVTIDVTHQLEYAMGLAVDSQGRIVVGGYCANLGFGWTVARLTLDGQLDTTF